MELERHLTSTIEQTAVPADSGREVHLVRLRLALVIIATALMASLAGGAVATVVAPDLGRYLGTLVRSAPLLSLAGAIVLFEAAFTLMLVLAHRVVAPTKQLDAARRRFGDMYVASESRALVDPLTGLGNHRDSRRNSSASSTSPGATATRSLSCSSTSTISRP